MRIDGKQLGFHWRGRTKEGVSKWTGSVEPLYWIGKIFSIYGPIAGIGGLAAFLYGLASHFAAPSLTLMAVGLIHFVLFTGIGQWALAMRRNILKLAPAEEVSAKLGVDQTELRELAEHRNIQPRIILNDQPYYDPTEFVDALSLLRASSARQDDPASLLHPVAGAPEAQSEELLRASPGTQPALSEDEQANVQRLGS